MSRIKQLVKEKIGKGREKKRKRVRKKSLSGCPQKRGVCMKLFIMTPKKPNSAQRKVAKVRLSNGKKVICYIPLGKHTLQQHSVVLIRGGGRIDLPGVKYKLIRGKWDLKSQELSRRKKSPSKYGISLKKLKSPLKKGKGKKRWK